ncbi:1,4-alpha-glucan branching protein GlgB [Botrimarina hoheduenensis]|uniref:1,4-alpha-glucan branching enzyme GlgB n=1 Tax=Botrimarina hoheduenensis TaxID=2528000 RepID=A0A5C5WEX9_9BACT|nr:1,4-alpha-glucan branching protein GlgB [Botrimarina hoheduenensis]TWT48663.1 1,4-alpha-glucan branching enzyme GlgB [Botrimarina hoheduenensis]
MRTQLSLDAVGALIQGRSENPAEILGPHEVVEGGRRAIAVRAFLPDSDRVWLVDSAQGSSRPMRRIHPAGLYEALWDGQDGEFGGAAKKPNYYLRYSDPNGGQQTMRDPYAFDPLLTEYDLHLLHEGTHWDAYERLGAHLREIDGVRGVNFAVWAPNAEAVSVVGDFNRWNGKAHAMRKRIPSGVWELFVPDMELGTLYKFAVKQLGGRVVEKCDPYGFAAEVPPKTANIVTDLSTHQWADGQWMAEREKHNALDAPMSIYELHLGSWRRDPGQPERWMSYNEIAPQLIEYCHRMGYTHIELMPVSEHPFTGSWGYQTVGYFAATSRYGSPADLMSFVDQLHQAGIGVIIDWVPAHFPKDDHGLRRFDGSALYEHADPRQGEHPDWGTMIFNYGRNEVSNFLLANALFWLDKYHIDGLRVDAVASMLYLDYSREGGEWVPNKYGGRENLESIDFLKRFNEVVHERHPGAMTIAEESTAWGGVSRPTYVGGLGFTLKWNMGWMNDTLRYIRHDPIHRGYHHDELTFSLIYAFTENFCLPFSHDEVVHGKGSMLDQMPGDMWQKFANLRLLYGYMWSHPGKKLLFMGGDFGQWSEWNCNESLQWHLLQYPSHQGLQNYVAHLNHLYRSEPALYEVDFDAAGFEWVDCHNHADSVLAYLRRAKDSEDYVVAVSNFTPVPRHGYKLGVPEVCWFEEISNSDSELFGGGNVGNSGGVMATTTGAQGRPASIEITLPPLATMIFKPRRG